MKEGVIMLRNVPAKKWLFYCAFLLTLFSTVSAGAVDAGLGMAKKERFGVIVATHGAPPMAGQWNQDVLKIVQSIKSPYHIENCFLDFIEEYSLPNAVKKMEALGMEEVLIVHFSPSSYSNHHEELKFYVNVPTSLPWYDKGWEVPIQSTIKKFAVSSGMDDHPYIIQILTEYAKELSVDPAKESLVLVGHGPVDELENIMWLRGYRHILAEIQDKLHFRETACQTLRYDSGDTIKEEANFEFRETVKRMAKNGKVIILCYVLGPVYLQNVVSNILKGVSPVVISPKGVATHPLATKWIEETIAKKMDQVQPPPPSRQWGHLDWERKKPVGTNKYGSCESP